MRGAVWMRTSTGMPAIGCRPSSRVRGRDADPHRVAGLVATLALGDVGAQPDDLAVQFRRGAPVEGRELHDGRLAAMDLVDVLRRHQFGVDLLTLGIGRFLVAGVCFRPRH